MSDDLIKRSDAIEQLNEAISICPPCMKGTGIYRTSALEEAIDIINQIPTADRPQGEWKEVYAETDYRNGWIEFSCECCEYQHGLESGEYGWSYGEPIPWKFCPMCGARMKGADDEV